jgi:hypothetical protein
VPVAAIAPVVGGALAGAGASSGGKKGAGAARKAAEQQFAIQSQQLNFGRDVFNTGMKAWQPAADYWTSLLSGDPNKMAEATGPTRDILNQQEGAQERSLAGLPAGGERNLAVAQAKQDNYNNIARLTAGVQPTAANALGQLAGLPVGAGVGIQGQGAPNVGAGLKFDTHQQEQKGQAGGAVGSGLGNILYSTLNRPRGSATSTGGAGK